MIGAEINDEGQQGGASIGARIGVEFAL